MVGEEASGQSQSPWTRFRRQPAGLRWTNYTFEDDRLSYREQRFVTLGLLAGVPVSLVHTESEYEIRIISFRKATEREAQIYFGAFKD